MYLSPVAVDLGAGPLTFRRCFPKFIPRSALEFRLSGGGPEAQAGLEAVSRVRPRQAAGHRSGHQPAALRLVQHSGPVPADGLFFRCRLSS